MKGGDSAGVLRQDGDWSRSCEAPNPDDLVRRAGGQQPIVFGHGHVRDLGGGASKGEVEPTVAGAPHLDKQVVGSGEDIAARFVKEEAEDWREVSKSPSLEAKVPVNSAGGITV